MASSRPSGMARRGEGGKRIAMLAFRIACRTGVVIARDRANRRRAEWPPHPDRLFSALAASWGRLGGAAGRNAVTPYVPRNDLPKIDKSRNARPFPAAPLEDPVVHVVWPDAEPGRPARPAPADYGEWQVFRRTGGVGLELRHAALLTHAAHRALVKLADERNAGPVRPVISGRDPDGGVTRGPHLALVPLANLDHEHADGAIMGFAAIYPGGLDKNARDYLDTAIAALDHVKMEVGVMGVRRIIDRDHTGLDPARYTRASRHWVTVTPLLFDRHPKRSLPAEAIVRRAVTDTGLPEPKEVTLGAWPVVAGVPPPRLMLPRPGHAFRQPPVHALIAFDQPVRGPVLIGAGRFFGLGLCLPIDLGGHAAMTRYQVGSRRLLTGAGSRRPS